MTTMEITASNGSSMPTESLLLSTLPLVVANKSGTIDDQAEVNDNSASSSTICFLSNGTGQIDRLNLVLPLTNAGNTSPPFSSHLINQTDMTFSDYHTDLDRTPVNAEKDFLFSPSSISQSSCRTVDSGTESICSESIDDYMNEMAADRILKFFSTDTSKSNRFGGRRPNTKSFRQRSTDDDDHDDDDDDDDEDIYSDESTLSESSLSPQDFDSKQMPITPESVVAAIDAKIKQREANQKLVNGDKTKSSESCIAADNSSSNDDRRSNSVQSNLPNADQTAIPSRVAQQLNGTNFSDSSDKLNKNKLETEDDIDYDEFDDDDDCPRVPLIRSTSLKSGKTPPGTPRGKKIVRFADALGLDLESVRHIVDDVPYIPPLAAFKGLKLDEDDKQWFFGPQGPQSPVLLQQHTSTPLSLSSLATKPNLKILFSQPSSDPGPFLERIRSFKVCLENCLVSGPSGPSDMFTITCIMRVLNIGFEKSVMLRYTTNEWLTWTDVLASYIPNSCDGFSDKFMVTFHLAVNSNGHQAMMPGQRLMFALRYLSNGNQEFWDNNMGLNYVLMYQRS